MLTSTSASANTSFQHSPLHAFKTPVLNGRRRRALRHQPLHLSRAAPQDEGKRDWRISGLPSRRVDSFSMEERDNMSEILKADMERMRSKQGASPSRPEESNPFDASQ
eukprot:scaffold70701_cov19-Tisochrysis_lutea.AAC.1